MDAALRPLFFAITLNFTTGEIGWSSSTAAGTTPTDPGDTLLLESGTTDDLLLETNDFLLLE